MTETVEAESIRITTSRPGHPLLVKVSYHPRWRAQGADGPYLASPGFMLIVPRERDVRLVYSARTGSDRLGLGLAVLPLAPPRRPGVAAQRGDPGEPPAAAGAGGCAPGRAAHPARRRCWPRCASFPSPRRRRIDALDELASRAYARSGGRTPPSTPATRPRCFRRPTRGEPSCSASRRGSPSCRSRARSGRAVHARRRGRAGAAPAAGAPLGRPRPRGGGRRRKALRPGAGGSARSTPKRRGRTVSRRRPTRPCARDQAHGRPTGRCYTRSRCGGIAARRPSRGFAGRRCGRVWSCWPRRPLSPAALRAEGLAIDHRKVGCIVAGKYPRLNACFAPASSLARARVYFRVATRRRTGTTSRWRRTRRATRAFCRGPKKELVGRRIQYYVDASTGPSRRAARRRPRRSWWRARPSATPKLPVAPLLNSATVAVFPSLPAGFARCAAGLGAGPRRCSRWAVPRSWGAGWPLRRGRRSGRVGSHHDAAAGGGIHDDGTDDDHHHHPAGVRLQPGLRGLRRRDPRRGRHDRRAPSRWCSASTCATPPAPSRCASRSRWTGSIGRTGATPSSPSRPSPRPRSVQERRAALGHGPRPARAHDDPVRWPRTTTRGPPAPDGAGEPRDEPRPAGARATSRARS